MNTRRRVPRETARDTTSIDRRRPEIVADAVGAVPALARVIQTGFSTVALGRAATC